MNILVGLYGASGFGREVMPLLRTQYGNNKVRYVFVDDNPVENVVNGCAVVTFAAFCQAPAADKCVSVAIADSTTRRSIEEKCKNEKLKLATITASNAVVGDHVVIGQGAILCSFTHLTSNIILGASFHANIYSYVGHDCIIGDYVTFAPAVKCNGNVHIHNNTYIGTGAIIKQGKPGAPLVIGEGAIVGMGAVVTKDVPAGVTVIGNPARVMVR